MRGLLNRLARLEEALARRPDRRPPSLLALLAPAVQREVIAAQRSESADSPEAILPQLPEPARSALTQLIALHAKLPSALLTELLALGEGDPELPADLDNATWHVGAPLEQLPERLQDAVKKVVSVK